MVFSISNQLDILITILTFVLMLNINRNYDYQGIWSKYITHIIKKI